MCNDGFRLEKDFAKWMEKELDFDSTEIRTSIRGKVTPTDFEVDIHGIKYDPVWNKLFKISLGLVVIIGVSIVLELTEILNVFFNLSRSIGLSSGINEAAFIFILIFSIVAFISRNKKTSHVWVECKDHEKAIGKSIIQSFINKANDVELSNDNSWVPDELYLVSGRSHFTDVVFKMQDEHPELNLRLFKKKKNAFIEIDRSNNR